jgi:mannose-6-phosphate isomerase-like protein (cupin superfamily)
MKILLILLVLIIAALWVSRNGHYDVHTDASVWGTNIEDATIKNNYWRQVLNTSENAQLTVMNVPVGDELGWEVHPDNDQLFRTERGTGEIWTSRDSHHEKSEKNRSFLITDFSKDNFVFVPKGHYHNVVNKGNDELKFYTIYTPPHHPPDRIDITHADELAREH